MFDGREMHNFDFIQKPTSGDRVVFEANGLSTKRLAFGCGLNGVSFSLREGEILGIAGVDGNGQSELVKAVLGLEKPTKGWIKFNNIYLNNMTNSKIRKSGVVCIPPDRQKQGLILELPIMNNILLGCENDKKITKGVLINIKKAIECTSALIKEYDIRSAYLDKPIKSLSGGNQQKVILARECELRESKLIVAVNPTRGLDIGAMEFVYSKLKAYKEQGKTILLISTELDEILRMSDKVAVLYKGSIMDIRDNIFLKKEEVGMLMAGIKNNALEEQECRENIK